MSLYALRTGRYDLDKDLIGLMEGTKDAYLIVAEVKALGKIGTQETTNCLETLRTHPDNMVKEVAREHSPRAITES